jgi:hypothetical protein
MELHRNLKPWLPGQSGNPNGRPVGSRSAFSAAFCRDLAEVWSDEGREAMLKTAKTNPVTFFAVCARLIGPEVKITLEQSLSGNLSAQDWAIMREIVDAVKAAIPARECLNGAFVGYPACCPAIVLCTVRPLVKNGGGAAIK